MKGFTHFTLAALATYASAASVNLNKRESPLSVVLSASGNTEVKVAVTNNGNRTLNLLSKGTFLDEENPVEKVSVFSTSGSKFSSHVFVFPPSRSLKRGASSRCFECQKDRSTPARLKDRVLKHRLIVRWPTCMLTSCSCESRVRGHQD
jgi:hypothetical protein